MRKDSLGKLSPPDCVVSSASPRLRTFLEEPDQLLLYRYVKGQISKGPLPKGFVHACDKCSESSLSLLCFLIS